MPQKEPKSTGWSILHDEVIADAIRVVGKTGQVTITAVRNGWINENPGLLIGYQRRIQGSIYGGCSPLVDVPHLIGLYQDMNDGKNIRGVIIHEH